MAAAQDNQKQALQLPPNELLERAYVSTQWDAEVQLGVTPQDALRPDFWAHQAVRLKPMDEVRVRARDGTWVGYYIVLDCSRTWAKLQQLSLHHLTTSDVAATQASEEDVRAFIAKHEVKHRGPHGWSILRRSDNAVIEQGIKIKDEALGWLDQYARKQVGVVPTPKAAAPAATTA